MSDYRRRTFIALAAAAMLAAAVPPGAGAQTTPARNRVVYQVSEANPQMWNVALNNVSNMQDALGAGGVQMEVVAYGFGVGMLKADSPVAKRVAETIKRGVRIVACENTMRGMNLSHADMLPDIGYVPSGVVEIMAKQQDGYAYIRP
jgi:uncharacterized protein